MASSVAPALPAVATPTAVESRLGRFSLAALLAAALLGCALLTRLALLIYARHDLDASITSVFQALAVGELFDLVASLWLVAPLVLVLAILPDRWFRRSAVRGWMRAWLFFLFALSAFVICAEVLFFDEFNGRFNFVAVDYLIYPTEVVTNLWESYPLPAILLGVIAVGVAGVWLSRRRIRRALDLPTPGARRLLTALAFLVSLGALTIGVSPEMARVSDDRALNEIALNGYYTFWLAFIGQDAPYEGLYATRHRRGRRCAPADAPRVRGCPRPDFHRASDAAARHRQQA